MKRAHWLSIGLICLGGIAVYFIRQDGAFISQEIASADRLLFPDLRIETIDQLSIHTQYNSVTLARNPSGWVYLEKENYPADETYIYEVLYGLTELLITQSESVDIQNLHHFDLLDPADERGDDLGVRVDCIDPAWSR